MLLLTQRFRRAMCLLGALALATAAQAQYYWVGGSGDWDDYANHWATTSGGSTFHIEAPTSSDDVIFDANSFSETGQTVSIGNEDAICANLNWEGVTDFPSFTAAGSGALEVYGNVTLDADMTCTLGFVELVGAGDHVLTSNGTSLGDNCTLRFYGTGTVSLADALTCSSIQHTTGGFDANNKDLNIGFNYYTSGAAAKAISLGTSTVTLQQWRMAGSNITFDAGSSTLVLSSLYMDQEGSGPYAYANVVLSNEGCLIEDSGSIDQLDVTGTGGGYVRFESGHTVTLGTLVGEGSRHLPLHFYTNAAGSAVTLNKASGSLDLDYIILKDIHTSGGASFTATNCLDEGGNAGWNITPLEIWDFHWVGNAGDWEDPAHWSSTSGGAADYDSFPSRFDNVIFDAGSFTMTGQSVTVNAPGRFRSIDATAVTNAPTLTAGYGNNMTAYGDVIIPDGMSMSIHNCSWDTDGAYTLSLGEDATISYPGFYNGVATLDGSIDCGSLSVQNAELHCGNATIDCSFNFSVYGSSVDLYLENADISCLRWQMNSDSFVLDAGTSKVTATGEFKGNGYTYHHVVLAEDVIAYASNTFETLEFAPGCLAKLPSDETQTVNGAVVAVGTPEAPASISATDDGVLATISKPSGTVNGTYLVLKDCAATGGATFNATQSIDNGNNPGWNITEIVPQDYYWVGGSGNWSDPAHWSSTSGGAPDYFFAPGVLDEVHFDGNSFSTAGATVTIDVDAINVHDLDWTGATGTPTFAMNGATVNLYGSLTLIADMVLQANTTDWYLLSPDSETLDFGDEFRPGSSAYLYAEGGGAWTLGSPLFCRELNLLSGTFNAGGQPMHVDFDTAFSGDGTKVLNVQDVTFFTRMMSWNTAFGSNLTLDGSGGTIQFSSSFTPYNVGQTTESTFTFGDLEVVGGTFSDTGSINASIEVGTLTVEPGKTLELAQFVELVVEELVVTGTEDDNITLRSVNTGTQPTISQAVGIVDGQYLQLQDIAAIGGATFYANNSLNLGNVSGWIFTGQAQSITFDPVSDVLEDVGTVTLTAEASSGLDVAFEVTSGPATVAGNVLTITGAGPVTVEANQSGDLTYNPAPSQSVTFCSIPLQPVITADYSGDAPVLTSSASVGNQWYLNGEAIDGATGNAHIATEDGSYTVQVEVDGCVGEVSDAVDVVVDNIHEWVLALNAYPNPTTDLLWLTGVHTPGTVVLLDPAGRVVRTQAWQPGQPLDVNPLPQGTYLLTLITAQATSQPLRVLKH